MLDSSLAAILDDLERGFDGDAWHGPPLRKVLAGVTAEVAAARPIPGGHNIREIVVHLFACDDMVARRIKENRAIETPDGGNFPPIEGTGPQAWENALSRLDERHAKLLQIVAGLDASRLGSPVVGKDYSLAHMLHGVAQHMAYHAGQIALLRKLAEAPVVGDQAS